METGKVEYAPDYKSKRGMGQPFSEFLAEQMRDPEFAEAYKATDVKVEHQRLQLAVVEAAKAVRCADRLFYSAPIAENSAAGSLAHHTFDAAVDALIAFEAEHKIGVE
jgi:uncharacterized protein YfeS